MLDFFLWFWQKNWIFAAGTFKKNGASCWELHFFFVKITHIFGDTPGESIFVGIFFDFENFHWKKNWATKGGNNWTRERQNVRMREQRKEVMIGIILPRPYSKLGYILVFFKTGFWIGQRQYYSNHSVVPLFQHFRRLKINLCHKLKNSFKNGFPIPFLRGTMCQKKNICDFSKKNRRSHLLSPKKKSQR